MTSTFTIDEKQIRVSIQPSQKARKTIGVKFVSSDELVVRYPYNKEVARAAIVGAPLKFAGGSVGPGD